MGIARENVEKLRVAGKVAKWGHIVGPLTDQLDLKSALDSKVPKSTFVKGVGALDGGGQLFGDLEITHADKNGTRHIPKDGSVTTTLGWDSEGKGKWQYPASKDAIDSGMEAQLTVTPFQLKASQTGNVAAPFKDTVTYEVGVIVTYQNIAYRSTTAILAGPFNYNQWRDIEKSGSAWDASAYYEAGDIVSRNGKAYLAVSNNTGSDPILGPSWDSLDSSQYVAGTYTPTAGSEYPNTATETTGATFFIVGGTYTFLTGDLTGLIVNDGDSLVWQGSTTWFIHYKPTTSVEKGGRSWNSTVGYLAGDIVSHSGYTFLCTANTTTEDPSDTNFWKFLATNPEKGGIAGVSGVAYTIGDTIGHNHKVWICEADTDKLPGEAGGTLSDWIISGAQYHHELHDAGTHTHANIDDHLDSVTADSGKPHIPVGGANEDLLGWNSTSKAKWLPRTEFIRDDLLGNGVINKALSANQGFVLDQKKADKVRKITSTQSITVNGVASGNSTLAADNAIGHVTTSGHKHIPAGGVNGYNILKWSTDGTAVWGNITTDYFVNSLTSTDTTRALTANQGKILQDGKANKTISVTTGGGLLLNGTANGSGTLASNLTVAHATTAGNKHIPAAGAAGNVLMWSTAGEASWTAGASEFLSANPSYANTSGLKVTDSDTVVLLTLDNGGTPTFELKRAAGNILDMVYTGILNIVSTIEKITLTAGTNKNIDLTVSGTGKATVNGGEILTALTSGIVKSDTTGVTNAIPINNVISLPEVDYQALVTAGTTDPNTLYVRT